MPLILIIWNLLITFQITLPCFLILTWIPTMWTDPHGDWTYFYDPSSFLTLIVSMHWTHLLSSINNALTFRVSPPVNGRSRGSNYEYGDKASRLLKHQLKRHAAGHTIPQIKNISGTFFKPWRSFIQYFTDLQTLPWFIFSFYTGLVFIGPISILLNCNC